MLCRTLPAPNNNSVILEVFLMYCIFFGGEFEDLISNYSNSLKKIGELFKLKIFSFKFFILIAFVLFLIVVLVFVLFEFFKKPIKLMDENTLCSVSLADLQKRQDFI